MKLRYDETFCNKNILKWVVRVSDIMFVVHHVWTKVKPCIVIKVDVGKTTVFDKNPLYTKTASLLNRGILIGWAGFKICHMFLPQKNKKKITVG